jgi:uncharacterized protein YxjI
MSNEERLRRDVENIKHEILEAQQEEDRVMEVMRKWLTKREKFAARIQTGFIFAMCITAIYALLVTILSIF